MKLSLQTRLAKGPIVLLLWALYLAIAGLLLPWASSQVSGLGPLDLRLFYSVETAYSVIASYGEAGRAFYALFEVTGDLLYPTIYTLTFSLTLSFLFARAFPTESRLQRLPLYLYPVWVLDLLENLCIVALLQLYPTEVPALVYVTQLFTTLKFSFILYAVVLLVIGLVGLVRRRRA